MGCYTLPPASRSAVGIAHVAWMHVSLSASVNRLEAGLRDAASLRMLKCALDRSSGSGFGCGRSSAMCQPACVMSTFCYSGLYIDLDM